MDWQQFKYILQTEIQNNLNKKLSNILKNSYPLLKNRSYGIIEFSVINTLAESDLWTVRDISSDNSFGTTSDIVFNYKGQDFPVSIKTSIASKSGTQLLQSRTQVETILTDLEINNFNSLINCNVFLIPIISIDFRDNNMSLSIKECKNVINNNIEWTIDLPKTASFKDEAGRSILTFSRKKGTITAYDGFFQSVSVLQEKCSDINLILYKIVDLLQSEENYQGLEKVV